MPKIFQEFMVGYNISVELKCNIVVSGILEAVDTLLNMQMSNATYHIIPDNEIDPMCKPMGPLEDKDTPLKVVKKIRQMAATRQPRIFIRGNHVRNIRIPEEVPLDSVTLVKAMGIADAEAHLEREKNLSITHNESISFLHWHNARNIDDDLARAEERLERKLLRKKDLEVPKEEIRKKLIDKHKLRLAQPFQYYRSEDGELKDRSPSPMLSWVPRDFDDMIDPNITFANFTNPYLTDEERNSINEIQTRNRKEWEEAEWGPMDIFERKFFSIPTDGSLYRNMNMSYSDVEKLDTTGYDPAYDVILKMKR
uniref:Sm domain-containing protein n=1 Tax=Amorphochlora amoebiformis TaxID=1561963 RepID=A0A7S0GYJ3_9EUKA